MSQHRTGADHRDRGWFAFRSPADSRHGADGSSTTGGTLAQQWSQRSDWRQMLP
jgi:hypothetical protein